ncbi:PIG-X [Trametes elegans]|nr:PIG-X [Trametes elegans]
MASLSTSLSSQGFHFSLSTTLHFPDTLDWDGRKLHVVYDLDPHVYADQYELAQRPGYSSLLWGTSDLEKPVSAVDGQGSVLLVTPDMSQMVEKGPTNITLEVPLHARYGRPTAGNAKNATYRIVLDRPLGFFELEQSSGTELPPSLQRYTALNGWPSPSSLSLIPDATPEESLEVTIPVGVLDDLAWVDAGTAVVMISMFFYLLHASVRTARRLSGQVSTKTD